MTALRFAWRSLWRDLKSGELAILAVALVVAVAAVAAVGLFTDRIARGMERQAGDILAADLVVSSRTEPDAALNEAADAAGLRTSARWSFASVVVAGERSTLANVKAVADGYPLRGEVRIADAPFAPQRAADGVPARGALWMDARLFAQLGVAPGARVMLGNASFVAERVLEYTPDEGFGFTSLAPPLLMHVADVPDTGLIQPGSRVQYRALFAGTPDAVDAFRARIEPDLARGQQILDVRESRPELGAALDRAGRFLGLAAVVAVLLAAVAVAMAARRYAARHLDAIAVIKCVGGTQGFVLRAFALQVLLVGVLGSVLGVLVGWLAQFVLVHLMADLLSIAELPVPRVGAAWTAVGTGLVMLAGFALPPLIPLKRVPPARVLRRDLDPPPLSAWVSYGVALAAVALLLYAQTGDAKLTGWVALGAAATGVVLAAGAWALLAAVSRSRGAVGVAWRYGLSNIARRRGESVAQIVAFGLGLMVLLLLGVVRADLMAGWRQTLADDAPNHFLINIQTHERAELARVFGDAGLETPTLFPMVRARLTHIGGTPVDDLEFTDPRARNFADREQNLSWMERPQPDNRIVAGDWWTADDYGQPLVSLEADAAGRFGVGVGDTLTYDIAGEALEVTIASLRTVDWESFNPNFFMVFPPQTLDGLPATWIGATYIAPSQRGALVELLRALPTITVIDIDAILDQVRRVVDQASRAVEFVFVFTLLAGTVVMLAAINASRDERLRESAMLRALGAGRSTVVRGLASEFVVLGALAGLLGAIAATGVGWLLAERVFEFDYRIDPLVWLVGLGAGGLGIGLVGIAATRSVLRVPPLAVLRRS